jgi:hypothetical protein
MKNQHHLHALHNETNITTPKSASFSQGSPPMSIHDRCREAGLMLTRKGSCLLIRIHCLIRDNSGIWSNDREKKSA